MSVKYKEFVCRWCEFGKKDPCILKVEVSAIYPEFCPWGYEEVEWKGSPKDVESQLQQPTPPAGNDA